MKIKHKILVVFGTRPEAIKMAPVIKVLNSHADKFVVDVCVTAQHRKMLDQVLEIFEIKPNYDLDLMHSNQSLSELTSRVLIGIQDVLRKSKPELVLVHGDTTTTLATSLACFYESIPIGHVEAGLRTNDITQPFPEELNRQVVGKISKIHFAPTNLAKSNLLNEGVLESSIYVTGNTVVDSLLIADQQFEIQPELKNRVLKNLNSILNFDITESKFVLITGHRRENFGQGFEQICKALYSLADKFKDVQFVYPVHLNPKVIEPVTNLLGDKTNIKLINPQDYLSFIALLKNCYLVLTDSGGVQEEAPSFGKPVLIMRNKTERTEAIVGGTAFLVGTDSNKIMESVTEFLKNEDLYESVSSAPNPFGDGNSSLRVVQAIINELNC